MEAICRRRLYLQPTFRRFFIFDRILLAFGGVGRWITVWARVTPRLDVSSDIWESLGARISDHYYRLLEVRLPTAADRYLWVWKRTKKY